MHHAGSGIGLALVKAFVELHKGTISVESDEKQGTIFTVDLPMQTCEVTVSVDSPLSSSIGASVSSALNNAQVAEEEEPEKDYDSSKPSVLVIDDNADIRSYVYSLLHTDYTVIEAADGSDGIRKAMKYVPDLIISDIMMPVKDGFTCCRELREQPRTAHIPILMLTAKAEDADVLQASKIGVDDYMMKPFNPEVLKAKVRNLILQRERLKRIYTKTLMLKQQESEPETDGNNAPDDFIQQIIHVIEANLANENFNVKMLADQLNMSQPTLYRKIKQRSELAAIDMIRSVRMGKAASLIMENRYSIQEIAEMVGYSDTRTLRKHFTEQFGVSPSKYICLLYTSPSPRD